MNEIKRFNNSRLTELLGLPPEQGPFIFKAADSRQVAHAEPHRKVLYSLGLVSQGSARLRVGLRLYKVQAPGLVLIGPDEVRQWLFDDEAGEAAAAGLLVTGVFFTEEFVVSGLTDALFVQRLPFYQKQGCHFLPLPPAEAPVFGQLLALIGQKYHAPDAHRLDSIQGLLRVLLLEAARLPANATHPATARPTQPQHLTARFRELLTAHFVEHRTVAYYADRLCVSPKHLSETVKAQTGRSVRAHIDELVCLEAKILLQVPALTVAQVAEQLHFANASFFAKFFRRGTGLSPQQYRHGLATG